MYPFKLLSATKDYVWGGIKLKEFFGKKSDTDVIAESWEVSCHIEGLSVIENGQYEGITLAEVLNANPQYKGENCKKFEFFPILTKLIDAQSNLSIQVHPDDEYALKNEGQYGKTEMWYIVECEDGAGVYCGFKSPISKETLKEALEQGKILDYLNFIKVNKGDCIFIPSGTVHAICGGCVICEIQQNSSLTYRLYDYDRVDKTGKKRQLHIDKAVAVTDTSKVSKANSEVVYVNDNVQILADCKYFKAKRLVFDSEIKLNVDESSFSTLTCVEGNAVIEYNGKSYEMNTGDTYFLPAGLGNYSINGKAVIVEASV